MIGWQNQYNIIQRVNRNVDQVQTIINFEKNPYLKNQLIVDHLDYEFPQSECFSIGQLIEQLKCNFTKIYKGQVLLIILEVLKHLQQLHEQSMSHGRLNPQNIIIHLQNNKNHKLTIYQVTFTIKQVYFINYRSIDDVQYQINFFQDKQDVINCCIQLITSLQNQFCELFSFIVQNLNLYKNKQDESDICKLIKFINSQIKEFVDLDRQKIRNIKISQQNIQSVQCQEVEEYSFISKRYRGENIIKNFVENQCNQSIIYELKINQKNENEYDINDQQPIELFTTSNLSQQELQIFNICQQIMKQQTMKIVWNQIGSFLESYSQEFDSKLKEILKIINQNNKQMLNNHLILLFQEYKNIQQIINEIEIENQKYYNFKIDCDKSIANYQFILELMIQAQNYDFQNIQTFINNVKSKVKQELQEQYDQLLELEILKLINDLI